MPIIDKRIDAYILKSQPFAHPILKKLRALIHEACPNIEETIKWGMPAFYYKGPVCGIAAFKQHTVFGFWKYKLMADPKGYLQEIANKGGLAMGNFGRITDVKMLPPDNVIIAFIKQACKLNDDGVKMPTKPKKSAVALAIPAYMLKTIKADKDVFEYWQKFSQSHKNEYVEWITEAKTETTRNKRIATMMEWLKEGKSRNWKYMKK